jgi:hypothetical protein
MKFRPESLTEANEKKRHIVYIMYDFEFTHDKEQLSKKKIQGEKIVIDQ